MYSLAKGTTWVVRVVHIVMLSINKAKRIINAMVYVNSGDSYPYRRPTPTPPPWKPYDSSTSCKVLSRYRDLSQPWCGYCALPLEDVR
jgi:hypothetical protein